MSDERVVAAEPPVAPSATLPEPLASLRPPFRVRRAPRPWLQFVRAIGVGVAVAIWLAPFDRPIATWSVPDMLRAWLRGVSLALVGFAWTLRRLPGGWVAHGDEAFSWLDHPRRRAAYVACLRWPPAAAAFGAAAGVALAASLLG